MHLAFTTDMDAPPRLLLDLVELLGEYTLLGRIGVARDLLQRYVAARS